MRNWWSNYEMTVGLLGGVLWALLVQPWLFHTPPSQESWAYFLAFLATWVLIKGCQRFLTGLISSRD